jgi:hypothetical protein
MVQAPDPPLSTGRRMASEAINITNTNTAASEQTYSPMLDRIASRVHDPILPAAAVGLGLSAGPVVSTPTPSDSGVVIVLAPAEQNDTAVNVCCWILAIALLAVVGWSIYLAVALFRDSPTAATCEITDEDEDEDEDEDDR